jgi:methenyltetrahydromethanopterin cyclohydrolase
MISVNRRAEIIVQQMIAEAESLGLNVIQLRNGGTVIDAGIHVPGSMEAGRLFASACLGGLGVVSFAHQTYGKQDSDFRSGFSLPTVTVEVQQPHLACMASQYAGWALKLKKYFAIGSGPARALVANEDIFRKLDYRDRPEVAILMLEGRQLPDETVAAYVAKQCHVNIEQLIILIAPTASIVGSVQIAARSIETGMHKLVELGFDVRQVKAASGLCPLAPVAGDDRKAIGRTNDAILYGSEVFFTIDAKDEDLDNIIEKIPSSSSSDYGTQFYELFMRYGGDFFKIDRMLFSPARVTLNNLQSGRVFVAGYINPSMLKASLLGG